MPDVENENTRPDDVVSESAKTQDINVNVAKATSIFVGIFISHGGSGKRMSCFYFLVRF